MAKQTATTTGSKLAVVKVDVQDKARGTVRLDWTNESGGAESDHLTERGLLQVIDSLGDNDAPNAQRAVAVAKFQLEAVRAALSKAPDDKAANPSTNSGVEG